MEALKKKIHSAGELFSLVKTMKALAAVNIRQYETALASLRQYFTTVETGLQAVLARVPKRTAGKQHPRRTTRGYILFGSDQGMCGSFNEQIVEATRTHWQENLASDQKTSVLTVGERLVPDFASTMYHGFSLPTQVRGITTRTQEILAVMDTWQQEQHIETIVMVHNKPLHPTGFQPVITRLLPMDQTWYEQLGHQTWSSRQIPLTTVELDVLLSRFSTQYLFASLHRIMAESMVAENSARLAAMQAAERNIEDLLGELTSHYHRERQNRITEELLDIIAGFSTIRQQHQEPREIPHPSPEKHTRPENAAP
jgi:F-type H+-transporting ATPase subunit gamma